MLLLGQNPSGASCAIPNKVSLNAFLDLSALYSLHVLPNLPLPCRRDSALVSSILSQLFHSRHNGHSLTQKHTPTIGLRASISFLGRLLPLLSCSLYSHFPQDCTQLLCCQGGLFWLSGLNHHQKNQNISHRVGVFSLFRKRNFSNSLILCPIITRQQWTWPKDKNKIELREALVVLPI